MKFNDLRRHWDRLGDMDPMWAIIADPKLSHNRWEARSEEFFKSGEGEANFLISALDKAGVSVARSRCLDFGCGLGRVTQALCLHFESVDGVDVARSMIRGARRFNRHGNRCKYHVNESSDLHLFRDATFDCVWSRLVLQHMLPEYSKKYIAEFIRVLKPGGAAFFEIPAAPREETSAGSDHGMDDGNQLPDGAHKAELTVIEAPKAVHAGAVFPVKVRVRNLSGSQWPSNELIRIGNHWKRAVRVTALDDGRASLPHELAPGEEAEVTLYARAPLGWGKYDLEFDVVEEGITWFGDRGSPTTTIQVRVATSIAAVARQIRYLREDRPAMPQIEMHFVTPSEVVATVAAAGGGVVDVSEWDVNPGYEDYRYIAVRPT